MLGLDFFSSSLSLALARLLEVCLETRLRPFFLTQILSCVLQHQLSYLAPSLNISAETRVSGLSISMKKASTERSNIDTRRSPATKHGVRRSSSKRSFLPANASASRSSSNNGHADDILASSNVTSSSVSKTSVSDDTIEKMAIEGNALSSAQVEGPGSLVGRSRGLQVNDNNPEQPPPQQQQQQQQRQTTQEKPKLATRFFETSKMIMFHSWVNLLLVFVPVGIIVKGLHVNPGVVFAMNAIAIVPLAGLLSHATESVASKLGDTVGALLNVTFGNAVELIIL